jgi:dTDP-4-dehydrorhamnose reductase
VSKLFVTGAGGYLGRAILGTARRLDINEFGSVRTGADHPPFTWQIDIRDEARFVEVFRTVNPHVVFHTAYKQHGPDARDVIVNGSASVASACAITRTPLVHISTDVVFDGTLGRPYLESDEPNPVTEYGRHKLEAEREVARLHPGALIVRTSLLYGGPGAPEPSNHERLAMDPGSTTFFTDEIRCPIQVYDLADALIEVGLYYQVGGKILHLVGPDAVSRHEFARLVRASRGLSPDGLASARAADLQEPRPLDLRLESGDRLRRLIIAPIRGVREVLRPSARASS